MTGTDTYMPKGAWVPHWWVAPTFGTPEWWSWAGSAHPPIQVEERMGNAAARYLAAGHSPARTRKHIANKFSEWAHLAGELVDAVTFAAEREGGRHAART